MENENQENGIAANMSEEEIIQVHNPRAEDQPVVDEQVLTMDDDTDTNSNVHPQAQVPIPPMEIVAFPNFNNLQPLMAEEIQEADLMGWINGEENELEVPLQEHDLEMPQNL